jgi:hypothetical protein
MYAGDMAFAALGFTLNKLFITVERRLLSWNTTASTQA